MHCALQLILLQCVFQLFCYCFKVPVAVAVCRYSQLRKDLLST